MSGSARAAAARPERLTRMARSIQAWQRALGAAATDGGVLEVGDLVGSLVRSAPSQSILNAAAAPHGAALNPGQLGELGAAYDAAGITAWGVWAYEDDEAATRALRAAGLTIDSRPTAMALDLGALRPAAPPEAFTLEQARDLAVLAEPLGAAYGFPPALLTHGLPRLLDHVDGWLARIDGTPAAGAAIVRAGDDAGVFLVGTAPEWRGRGAAAALLHHALLHARDRGCASSTLQASAMGRSVYARLGYDQLGRYGLWERRSGR